MDFCILGPLAVRDDDRELSLGGGKQRAVLALLLIHPNESLSTDRLIDELWDESPPPTAGKILQNYVSQLRRVLGDDRLQTQARGYALRVEPGELDLDRFRQRFEEGRRARAAGDPERAVLLLREALALWRGAPLADFAYEPFARDEIGRLEELRLSALVERLDADLALGRHVDLIGELEALVAQHPLQERLRGQLMLALYRSGRQAEALQVYQDARRTLAEELGLEPGQALQRLEQSILTHDPAIEQPTSEQSRPAAAGARTGSRRWPAMLRSQRLLVTVLAAAAAVGAGAAVLFIWNDNSVPVAPITGNAVAIIDPHSNRVTGQVAVGAAPGALAVGNGSLWVANTDDLSVSRVDLASGKETRAIAIGGVPISLAVGRNAVWVVRRHPDGYPELIRIDPRFDVVAQGRRLLRGGDPQPFGGASVAAGRDGVWAAAEGGSLRASRSCGKGGHKYRNGHQHRQRRDRRGRRVGQRLARQQRRPHRPGPEPRDCDDPGRKRAGRNRGGAGAVWVADRRDGAVVRIDPVTYSVTTMIPVGRGPTGIAVGLGSVWVANSRDGTVSRIDPVRKEVAQTIRVGGSPRAIAVGNGRVWVSVQTALFNPGIQAGVLRVQSIGHRLARSRNRLHVLVLDDRVRDLCWVAQLPGPCGAGGVAARSRSCGGHAGALRRRKELHVHDQARLPLLAAVERSRYRADLQVLDRARAKPEDPRGPGEELRRRHRRRASLRSRQGEAHLRHQRPREHADRPADGCLPGHPVAALGDSFCPVPPGTPVDAKGVNTVPSAGPYYVASYSPEQGAVLKRNPNYHGPRPHGLDEIDYDDQYR